MKAEDSNDEFGSEAFTPEAVSPNMPVVSEARQANFPKKVFVRPLVA